MIDLVEGFISVGEIEDGEIAIITQEDMNSRIVYQVILQRENALDLAYAIIDKFEEIDENYNILSKM
jgi:hypothetical protein